MTTAPLPAGAVPVPRVAITGVEGVPHAAAPTLRFAGEVEDDTGAEIYTVALTAQIAIEPARRRYDAGDHDRMADLFGEAARWPGTTHHFPWARVDVLVPSFRGRGPFTLEVHCTYDHEVAAAKYLASLDGGEVPLNFHFSGTVLYRGALDRLQMTPVPWSESARFAMPLGVWRDTMEHYFPGSGWIRLRDETLTALRRRAAERGLPTLEALVEEMLAEGARAP